MRLISALGLAFLSAISFTACDPSGQTTIGPLFYPGVLISNSNSGVSLSSAEIDVGGSVNVTVYLRDNGGNAYVSDTPTVSLRATGGTSGGTFSPVTNNGNGSYSCIFLGTSSGTPTSIQAIVNGSALSSPSPTITVVSVATSVTISSGNNQIGQIGNDLSSPFQVVVKDIYGNLVTGATVNWAVTAGGGSLSSTSNSSVSGVSSSTLMLGSAVGANTVTATIGGTSTSVTFSASGIAYSHIRPLTIDHTKVGASNSSNFPMLFSGTYSYLATAANGGGVTNSNGYDIIFTTDELCSNKVPGWQIESYSASTGAVNIWVDVPNLSSTADTVIYLCYGNSSISSFQSTAANTWDSNYLGVWHMSDDAANASVADSTGLNDGVNTENTNSKSVPGKIGNALSYNGSSDGTDLGTAISYVSPGVPFTIEVWAYLSTLSGYPTLLELDDSGGNNWELFASNQYGFIGFDIGSQYGWATGYTDASAPIGSWHHLVSTYSGGSQSAISSYALYLDGVSQTLGTPSGFGGHPNHTFFGRDDSNFFSGNLDEIRFSQSQRSVDWITAEYNNQNSPSNFYSVGSEL